MKIEINSKDFKPAHIFECGQCFRWEKIDDCYVGTVRARVARVYDDGIECDEADVAMWTDYFDLKRDYAPIAEELRSDERLCPAVDFGRGLRILRQEPWEALCSFIISQCNNIPRISSIIKKLCESFGEPTKSGTYSFPSPERLAGAKLSDIRAGYREEYILRASEAVASGKLNLEDLRDMPTDYARGELLKLYGVGRKVADCVLLFGLGKLDAFPIDVWMKRALREIIGDVPIKSEFPGIAQQYLFYYMRSTADEKR